ncbi:sensor histidine kinase [Nocardia farcinica]|uniref:sensor histidine kinase n=1 Tax=Nocardia farcinica TaxID=37329 RepID=UPI002456B91C|nr:histidine kinase [Nocardia farcinica]
MPLPWRAAAAPVALGFVLTRGATPVDLGLVAAAGALLVAGVRWPLPVVAAQAVLLVAAHEFGHAAAIGVKATAALALADLALRRGPRRQAAGAAMLVAAYLVLEFRSSTPGSVPLPYRLLLLVVLPVLLGGYLATMRRRAEVVERNAGLLAQAARRGERVQLARDLHDIVAHHVSAILVRVGMARHLPDLGPDRTAAVLADIHGAAETALRDLHDLMNVLREDTDRAGPGPVLAGDRPILPDLIEGLLDTARRAGLRVRATIDPAIAGLDGVRGLVLHRTIQEGVTNAIKHAPPGAGLSVAAALDGSGAVQVRMENDVGGERDRTTGGFGLIGMRERLATVGGSLDCGPAGQVWRLAAMIPPRGPS